MVLILIPEYNILCLDLWLISKIKKIGLATEEPLVFVQGNVWSLLDRKCVCKDHPDMIIAAQVKNDYTHAWYTHIDIRPVSKPNHTTTTRK